MNLKWFYVIFALLINANALSEGKLEASITLTALAYEDACYKSAESQWNFIENPDNVTLQSWMNASIDYGSFKCEEQIRFKDSVNKHISNASIQYKYNLVSKPGDALLECKHGNHDDSWRTIVEFIGNVEYLKLTRNYSNTSDGNKLFRKDAETLLSRGGSVDDKLKAWNMWHQILMSLTTQFSNNMQLIEKAAIDNGASDVTDYWEMLSEYEDGYTIATNKWNEISTFHDKVVKFVKTRLAEKYGDSIEKDTLPPHLLGSLQGNDWTPLALDVIPHTSITYEMRKNIVKKGLVGKNLYKTASRLAKATLKHLPEANFFNESDFQGQCPSKLINLCHKGRMRISTCSNPSISNYLSAHKNIAKILIHQMSEESNPILNFANRYSALEEGVSELFGILATSNSWLQSLNLMNETDDVEDARIVSLLITALDVLPRLAYYHSADMWRIHSIKNNTLKPKDLIHSWWQYRLQYESITTHLIELPTFLDDNIITSNRPYLSKFIGTILAFQIYEYLLESTEVMFDKIETIPINQNLIKMIQHGCAENWYEVVKKYLKFSDINVDPLLTYFTPLEEYIDEYETENDVLESNKLGENLEKIEDEFKKNFDNPTTTTTTTMKSTIVNLPKTFVTKTPSVKNDGSQSMESENSRKSDVSQVKPVSNSGVQADATRAPEKISTVNPFDNIGTIEDGNIIKGTSKAVWAVSAVLLAVIAIIILAIFGRQRCRKTPKNRRYV